MNKILITLTILIGLSTLNLTASAEALQCGSVPALMNVFLNNHLAINTLNDEVKERTTSLFVKFIDPSKQLLLKSDEAKIHKMMLDLFTTMKSGNCSALSEVGQILLSRAQENATYVTSKLGKDFKLNEDVKFQTDSKKREYAKDEAQKKINLDAAVHTQVATIMAGDVAVDKAKTQLIKRYNLSVKRSKEMTNAKMITLFAEAFAHSLDPHSDYLSPEQLDEFRINMNLSLEGIGVSLSSDDGYTIVQEIIPGGSAGRQKALNPKDKIIAVTQDKGESVSIIDMDLSDVVKMIRGKKGTKVTLTVMRQKGNKSETFNTTIVRDKVDMKEQAAKVSYENRKVNGKMAKIAVVDLPSFYGGSDKNARDCYTDLKKIVEEASAKKVDGMIIDLSSNGGGLLQDAVRIAGLFIKTGPVVATIDGKKNREILSDEDPKIVYNGPLMILTTRQSASASEIFAGAMKDYKRALIVGGDHTYGKGSVQVLNPLPLSLGAMKLTTQMFYLPAGASTQHAGVAADIALPSYLDSDDLGEQYMDYALPPAKTEAFLSMDAAQSKDQKEAWTPVSNDIIASLKEKSSKRVSSNSDFKDIVKELEDMKKNEGLIKVADIIQKSSKDKVKRKEKKEKSASASGRKELWLKDPHVQEAIQIMSDWLETKAKPMAKN